MKKALRQEDFYFHNDFYDMVAKQPEKYDYDTIIQVCILSISNRYKLLDYLFKGLLSSYEEVLLFKQELVDIGIYEDYKKRIIKGNDSFLKACLVLYFENDLKNDLFNDNLEIAKTIVKDKDTDIGLKITNLINISQFKCNSETIKYIKDNIKSLLNSYLQEDEKNNMQNYIDTYYQIIDSNQKILNDELSYKYKR